MRQLGDATLEEVPAPLLKVGSSYVLFIRPTELPGAESQFYVTGGDAGILIVDGGRVQRLVPDSGDTFPESFAAAVLDQG